MSGKPKKPKYRTIKILDSTYITLQTLMGDVAAAGWASVGSSSKAVPTQALVVDQALVNMKKQITAKK